MNTKDVFEKAKELLSEMYKNGTKIRLVGIRVENLVEREDEQISFFEKEKDEKQEKIDEVLDKLRDKYGYNKISRATKIEADKIINRGVD